MSNSENSSNSQNKSNFQKVVDWNKTFGVPVFDKPQKDIFDRDPKLVKLRFDLIAEEVRELGDAIRDKNMKEVLDALCDILVVTYGAGASFGLDLDKGMDIVNNSNMSKSCSSEEQAKETVEWYVKHPKYSKLYDSPAYRKSDNGDYWVVYNKSTGKILKSIDWIEADFKEILDK